jgi:signal transduction histidine kinase
MGAAARDRDHRAPTIRRQLIWVVLAAALPVWLASALLLYEVHLRERALDERNAGATARALALAVDRDLASALTAAQILATAPALAADDLAGFHVRATVALSSGAGDNVVLSDASGQQLVNTLGPHGVALPRHGNPDQLRKVLESRQPAISDLYTGGLLQRPVISVDVPVLRDGRVAYVLSVGLFPERFGKILRDQRLPPAWVAVIFDTRGVVVARTHSPERYVGQKGSPALVARIAQEAQGLVRTTTLEGTDVSAVFSRLQLAPWSVAIALPTAEVEARLSQSLRLSIAVTLALVVLGVFGARVVGERLARPIRALVAPALAHGRGERVEFVPLGLAEADEVGRALAEGSRRLEERTGERDSAEQAKRQSLEAMQAAEDAAHARSTYFAYLSHELRTPLTAILGYADLLSSRTRNVAGDPRLQSYCRRIEQGVRHLLAVVNDILDYAKFEAHEIVLRKERVDIGAEIRNALGLVAGNAERGGVELRCEIAPGLPPLVADPVRLRQVLLNLLSNAVKFTRRGGVVHVGARAEAGQMVIEVRDQGIGIPPEDLPRVLEPFGQAKDPLSRKGEGTGLGLPLAKGLVELHGGAFELASELGFGTTITIRLPLGVEGDLAS